MRNFELTNYDIKKAIRNKEFQSKYNIRYHEALFMRYLNESKEITVEQMDILANKYKFSNRISINNLCINNEAFKNNKSYGLFNNYLENINFNKYSMFEVILAAKAYYYDKSRFLTYDTSLVEELYKTLFKEENISMSAKQIQRKVENLEKEYCEVLKNHALTGLIKCGNDDCYYTNISKKRAKHELEEYTKLYGEDKVNKIKKYVVKQYNDYK